MPVVNMTLTGQNIRNIRCQRGDALPTVDNLVVEK